VVVSGLRRVIVSGMVAFFRRVVVPGLRCVIAFFRCVVVPGGFRGGKQGEGGDADEGE
jgi:hypothetical protein